MLKLEEIINLLENDGDIKENVSLKTLTTLKVGGISKYVFYPKDVTSLKKALTLFKENNINYKIFGNVLVCMGRWEGVVFTSIIMIILTSSMPLINKFLWWSFGERRENLRKIKQTEKI